MTLRSPPLPTTHFDVYKETNSLTHLANATTLGYSSLHAIPNVITLRFDIVFQPRETSNSVPEYVFSTSMINPTKLIAKNFTSHVNISTPGAKFSTSPHLMPKNKGALPPPNQETANAPRQTTEVALVISKKFRTEPEKRNKKLKQLK